jgi:elongation factor G
MSVVEAQVPLAEMFGFSTILRSSTQGQAQFTMELATYKQVPRSIAEELMKKAEKEKKNIS